MAIRKDQSGMARGGRNQGGRPPDAPRIFPKVLDRWWEEWQKREGFHRPMSIEDREYRGSWAGMRCDRQLWYMITGEPESNPTGPSGHWRMAAGTMIHLLLDEHVIPALDEEYTDIFPEMAIDLRPLGLNGASSGDLVCLDHRSKTGDVIELKTKGGYKFKLCVMGFQGSAPSGPEYGDSVQGALATKGVQAKYPDYDIRCRIVYLSLENISENIAKKAELTEYEKFLGEWELTQAEVDTLVEREVERANRIIADPMVPKRIIDDVDEKMPVRRMEVTNIDKQTLVGSLDGSVVYGETWRCAYCRFNKTCRADG